MRKTLLTAGLLGGALMIASAATAQSNDVEVKLTIDRSDAVEVTYQKVQEEASRVCLKDTHCKEALTMALLNEIGDEALLELHLSGDVEIMPYDIASTNQ